MANVIQGLNGQYYQLQSGIILGENFLSKDDFRKAFKDLLEANGRYVNLRKNLTKARKLITMIKTENGIQKSYEFTNNFEAICIEFSHWLDDVLQQGQLGGNISLLTTFNFDKQSQKSYFLKNEKDLPSKKNVLGGLTYYNTQAEVKKLLTSSKKATLFNKVITNHLNNFYNQLESKGTQTKKEYQTMKVWAYYNMRARYEELKKNKYPIPMGYYFWGNGKRSGYTNEAFTIHLSLKHPDVLNNVYLNKAIQIKNGVFEEHGGAGSIELFNLLASTKGQTSSQLGGDVIIVNNTNGKNSIVFNIQSKANKSSNYNIFITYSDFLKKITLFLETYEKYIDNVDAIEQQDIDVLFNAFAAEAWVPIEKEITEELSKKVDTMIKKGIPKNLTKSK